MNILWVTVPLWFVIMLPIVGILVGVLVAAAWVAVHVPAVKVTIPPGIEWQSTEERDRYEPPVAGLDDYDPKEVAVGGDSSGLKATDPIAGPVVDVAGNPISASAPKVASGRRVYWYYVEGCKDRFSTLKEAVTATGMTFPVGSERRWSTVPAEVRKRISREKYAPDMQGKE